MVTQESIYCIGCSYCLVGLTVSRCPECGRVYDASDPRTYRGSPARIKANARALARGIYGTCLAGSLAALALTIYAEIAIFNPFVALVLRGLSVLPALAMVFCASVLGWLDRPSRGRTAIRWIVAVLVLTAGFFGVPQFGRVLEERRTQQTIATIQDLVRDVELFRIEHGHAPRNEFAVGRKAVVRSGWGDPLHYELDSRSTYHYKIWVTNGLASTVFEFDSEKPEAGVLVYPF